ncbi:substrate-binding periplasmic protein [Paludibacterium purpuratum]|uniref:Amino acid ABC transporter substrate-binding protein (PAAT family) n=1 Tax=Paludibacterium purpuratum TaxID=1144873 RepID=A0A4R7B996_9NEIS|nr:transporter substrate-binding domain-containing protein [Paludibacterium purpuratum]TDR80542.1 amino acid ABC transporter substrate-binding protein (PAAT family) [Paludibacterium purpuratum]
MGAFLCRTVLCAGLMAVSAAWGQPTMHLLTEQYPPFNMTMPNGQVGGMATEMVRELFRRTKLPYQIELQPWIRAFNTAVLENNTCVYSTTRTDNRERQFKWVGPLVENTWALYGVQADPKSILALDDARPFTIGGYIGDAESQYLIGLGFNVQLTPTDDLNLRKLEAGRIDFWATSKLRGAYLIKQQKAEQVKLLLTFNNVFMYLACNTKVPDATIRRLNDTLSIMQHDGFYDQLHKRYLNE